MNDLRLNRRDGIFILVCLLVFAVGLAVSFRYFKKAFPESSIDFRYDRAQSGVIAQHFADSLGWQIPGGDRHASRFGYDDLAKTYLEKELGVQGAQKYLGKPIRLWYWQHRWFRPSTKEEFQIFVTPDGGVVRATHEVAEDQAGADLPEDSARALAEQFLFGTMGQDSSTLTFIESQRIGRPNRADWTFTWRARGIEPVKGSEYRYSVGVIGDQFGSYREWLKVPEEWMASYRKLRSYNDAAGQTDAIGLILTAIAMISVFFLRSRRKDIRWGTAWKFGLVATILVALNQINQFPQSLYGYATEDSWSGFLLMDILISVVQALGAGAAIFLLTASAEPLYRERYGDKLSLSRMFTAHGLRTKQAFKSILLGITLASFFFAYQIAFYLIAEKYGAWSPSDVPYDNLLNTIMPWLAVLSIGFFPAVTEEFMSRMFSIPFLQKVFRNRMTWLALLIPAVIWGFGHATYPNQPWWIRGVEVGIAGIIIGFIMLKWGILATLVWHYTVDALYTAFLLFRSHNVYFVLTAAVATGLLVIPLLLAFMAYLRKGAFLPEEGVRNADEVSAAPPPSEPESVSTPMEAPVITYRKLPNRNRLIGLGVLVVGIVCLFIPVTKIGEFLSYPLKEDDAVKTFADSLRSVGWADPDTLTMTAYINEDERGNETGDALVYMMKHMNSVQEFNQFADERLGVGRWRVYAWKPENRLRYRGSVNARSGEIEHMYAWLPEEMPGDSLSKDSAEAMVEHALVEQGEDTSTLVLKEYRDFARPHRLDHAFTYEAKEGDPRNIAEAKYRRSGYVDGSYLTVGRRPWYKVPETWTRDRNATTAIRAVRQGLSIVAIIGAIVWAIMLLGSRARQGQVPWKRVLLIAIVPGALTLLAGFNQWYMMQSQYFYNVETPASVYRMTVMITILLSGVMSYVLFVIGLAFLSSLYPGKVPLLKIYERRAAIMDTWIAAAAGVGFAMITASTAHWLGAWNLHWIVFSGWDVPAAIAGPLSFMTMINSSLTATLLMVALAAVVVYSWNGPLRKPVYRILMLIGLVFMLMAMNARNPNEWLYEAIHSAIGIAIAWFLLRYVIGGRTTAFIAAPFGAAAYVIASGAIGTGNEAAIGNAWLFIVIAFLVFAFWWAPMWGKRRLPVD